MTSDRETLRRDRHRLRTVLHALLTSPLISERDLDPEWACAETEEAILRAEAALRETAHD